MKDTHSKYYPPRYVTSLSKIDKCTWKWDPLYVGEPRERLLCEPNIMNKDTLEKYIKMFQTFSNYKGLSKYVHISNWERDVPKVRFGISHSEVIDNKYDIVIYIPNKYNKDFVYGDEKVLARFQMEEWSDNYLGTPESYGVFSGATMTREDLEKYIKELIEEYEDATGEKYK